VQITLMLAAGARRTAVGTAVAAIRAFRLRLYLGALVSERLVAERGRAPLKQS
jgi:hypothetical protein